MDDINKLINDSASSDRKAQERLFQLHYEFAMRLALRFARDEQDAADIASRAFYKMFKSLHAFDPVKGSFKGWFKKIVINEGIDHLKGRKKQGFGQLSDGIVAESKAFFVDDKFELNNVMQEIRRLPISTYTVFILFVVEGYAHHEIASLLSISEGTSKWHVSEARRILRTKMSAD